MTPQELDGKLRELSEHELLYRQGVDPNLLTPRDRYHEVQENGVLRSRPNEHLQQYDPNAPNSSSPFWVRRHSRFRDYPPHQLSCVELAYVYDGTASKVVNGQTLNLERGQVLIVDSDVIHTTLPLSEDDILITVQIDKRYFDERFLPRLDSNSILGSFFLSAIAKNTSHDGYILFHSGSSRRLSVFTTEFLCEWYDPCRRHTEMLSNLFSLMASELACVYEYEYEAERGGSTRQDTVLKVLREIERNCRDCSLKETARSFNMAPDSLSRLLKRETGSTFNQLVQKQRISIAKALLANGDLPVLGVAKQVGYENMTFFYRMFQRACGISPGEYRKRALEHGEQQGL